MGMGTHASQHWAVGVWSDDRGITHHAKGGPAKHELWAAAADSCQWAPALGRAYRSTARPCHQSPLSLTGNAAGKGLS